MSVDVKFNLGFVCLFSCLFVCCLVYTGNQPGGASVVS